MRKWADVAYLAKVKSSGIRFVAYAATGLPFLLEEGMQVAFVPPKLDVIRNARVSSVQPIDSRSADIAFEGVGAGEAGLLAGMHCLVRLSDLDDSVFEQEPAFWEGFVVSDASLGDVGTVGGIVQRPGQPLLEVMMRDGGSALVPLVDEIVTDVDVERGVVSVDLPQGILDL